MYLIYFQDSELADLEVDNFKDIQQKVVNYFFENGGFKKIFKITDEDENIIELGNLNQKIEQDLEIANEDSGISFEGLDLLKQDFYQNLI